MTSPIRASAWRSPQTGAESGIPELAAVSSQLSDAASRREWQALIREPNAEVRGKSLATFARRLESQKLGEPARTLWSYLAANEELPAALRAEADAQQKAALGQGSFAVQAETQLTQCLDGAGDLKTILPMMGASLIGSAVRAFSFARLGANPSLLAWGGGAIRAAASALGFASEGLGFAVLNRVASGAAAPAFGTSLASIYLGLGAMKLVGGTAGRLTRSWQDSAAKQALPEFAKVLGLMGAHAAEERLGLRPASEGGAFVLGALSTWLSLETGMRLGRGLFGPVLSRAPAEWNLRSPAEPARPDFRFLPETAAAGAGKAQLRALPAHVLLSVGDGEGSGGKKNKIVLADPQANELLKQDQDLNREYADWTGLNNLKFSAEDKEWAEQALTRSEEDVSRFLEDNPLNWSWNRRIQWARRFTVTTALPWLWRTHLNPPDLPFTLDGQAAHAIFSMADRGKITETRPYALKMLERHLEYRRSFRGFFSRLGHVLSRLIIWDDGSPAGFGMKAADQLGTGGATEAIPALLELWKHENKWWAVRNGGIRSALAVALFRLGAPEGRAILRKLAAGKSGNIALEAAGQLAKTGDPVGLQHLRRIARGDDAANAVAAAELLLMLGNEAPLVDLAGILAKAGDVLISTSNQIALEKTIKLLGNPKSRQLDEIVGALQGILRLPGREAAVSEVLRFDYYHKRLGFSLLAMRSLWNLGEHDEVDAFVKTMEILDQRDGFDKFFKNGVEVRHAVRALKNWRNVFRDQPEQIATFFQIIEDNFESQTGWWKKLARSAE